jgi:pimeloyl-ACP methyl ester carboxylesterase
VSLDPRPKHRSIFPHVIESPQPLAEHLTPDGIHSRMISGVNGLTMHVLEAGQSAPGVPTVLLLHGFPELAYSWRQIMVPLVNAGFHVVAPDQRGYGRTVGWSDAYEDDVSPFRMFNLVRDALGLLKSLGLDSVHAVIGHDFGSPVAAWCGVLRPDIFRSVGLMSAPFGGPPPLPEAATRGKPTRDVHAELLALERPRKHYQWYYSTRAANADMVNSAQGLKSFLRAYFHMKSAGWVANSPYPLEGWRAEELAKLPTYYVMDADQDMAQTVRSDDPGGALAFLDDAELDVYTQEYGRTGFQGGLNWYRCATDPSFLPELQLMSGRKIGVPACFIAGASDWGVFQKPGDYERMYESVCTDIRDIKLIDGAGHWVQQEQPAAVLDTLIPFLNATR